MCEKDATYSIPYIQLSGSPPRVREGLVSVRVYAHLNGITPARAGRTVKHWRKYTQSKDHPRSRGKDKMNPRICLIPQGSPPLAREGHSEERFHTKEAGITPACAGRTAQLLLKPFRRQDHPRMCGKDLIVLIRGDGKLGSPPHVREGPSFHYFRKTLSRITPACAGRTHIVKCIWREFQDHPRMCGKDVDFLYASITALGSPPHVREGPFV